MKSETEKGTKSKTIKNSRTGKEATIERKGDKTAIISESKTETPKAETGNSAAIHIAAEAKAKAEKTEAKAKAKAKTKAKPKTKKKVSPLRKITLSRTTMQVTIPSNARDKMLKFLNIKLEDLKAKRSLTTWDGKLGALVTRIVKAE